jgi:periplasmic protein TonB
VAAPASQISTSSPAAPTASSNDALGSDDIQIALTTYSPSPKPDLSRMPRGAQGEVVLDVTIDPTGQVADLQILATLGYGVEGAVVDTVRTWKFSPATKDGVPVASVQELHFHYGPV